MDLDDATHTDISTLKEGFEGQFREKIIEIFMVGTNLKFIVLNLAEINNILLRWNKIHIVF